MNKEYYLNIMKEICIEAEERFTNLFANDFLIEKFKSENLKLENFEDINLYNIKKILIEADSRVKQNFINIIIDINCELSQRNFRRRFVVFEVRRTLYTQARYWLQGRYIDLDKPIITYALPGQGFHHYGCAIDIVPWRPEDSFTWSYPEYWKIKKIYANKYNAITYSWDSPHLEYRFPDIEKFRKEVSKFIFLKMKEKSLDPTYKIKSIPDWLKNLK